MVPSEASSRRDSPGAGSGSFTPTWTNPTSTSLAGSASRLRFSSEPFEGTSRRVTPFLANALAYRSAALWKLLPLGPVEMVMDDGAAGRTKCSTAQVAAASTSESGNRVTSTSRQERRKKRDRRRRVLVVSMGLRAFSQTRARVATKLQVNVASRSSGKRSRTDQPSGTPRKRRSRLRLHRHHLGSAPRRKGSAPHSRNTARGPRALLRRPSRPCGCSPASPGS